MLFNGKLVEKIFLKASKRVTVRVLYFIFELF